MKQVTKTNINFNEKKYIRSLEKEFSILFDNNSCASMIGPSFAFVEYPFPNYYPPIWRTIKEYRSQNYEDLGIFLYSFIQ